MIQRFHDGNDDMARTLAVIRFDFDDLRYLGEVVPLLVNADVNRDHHTGDPARVLDKGTGASWYGGCVTMADVNKLVDDGWNDGATRGTGIALTLEGTVDAAESIRRRAKWGEDGEELDPDRALRGDWDTAFLSMPRLRGSGTKIVTLYGPVGGNCNKSADELFWNGVQLVVICDLLEQAGYQTEVYGSSLATMNYGSPSILGLKTCRGKVAGEPLRVDTLASLFAHAGIFRTYYFHSTTLLETPVHEGLGHSRMDAGTMTAVHNTCFENGWLPQGFVVGEAFSMESAIANIKATLHAITGAASL